MKYIIKNTKLNNYYQKTLKTGFHFVQDIDEAYIFKNKKEANKVYSTFKKLRQYENLEIIRR